jgi:hypothetical protein
MSLKGLVDDVTREVGYEIKNNEVLYHCPVCHHPKRELSVNLDTHKWKRWVCCKTQGTEGASMKTLFRLFKANQGFINKLNDFGYKPSKTDDEEKKYVPKIHLPNEFISLTKPSKDMNYRHAIHYLNKRGITLTDIVKYNIGYCNEGEFANYIIFPSYDEHGILNYFTGRTWYSHYSKKYKKPPYSSHKAIGLEFFVNWKYPVYLCEGIFDAMAIKRNAIPLYGKTIGSALKEKLIINKPQTYLIFDNDAIGDLRVTCEELVRYEVPIFPVILSEKDPSEMGYNKIHELINNTKELSFLDLIKLKISS